MARRAFLAAGIRNVKDASASRSCSDANRSRVDDSQRAEIAAIAGRPQRDLLGPADRSAAGSSELTTPLMPIVEPVLQKEVRGWPDGHPLGLENSATCGPLPARGGSTGLVPGTRTISEHHEHPLWQ